MKRKLAAVLACMLTVSALAACGKGEGTGTAPGNTNTESSATSSSSSATQQVQIAESTISPSVELVKVEGDVTVLSELPVEEYVTLGDYKNLEIAVTPKTEYTDEEIAAQVRYAFSSDLVLANKNGVSDLFNKGVVANGDFALIDYVGKLDGVAFEGGSAVDSVLDIGSGTFIDGFEEGLVGVKTGDIVDLKLTFPATYSNTELAGKDVVFTVSVKGIAQLTDEAIVKLSYGGDITTVDKYREAVVANLQYDAESKYYENFVLATCEALLKNSTISKMPESYFLLQKEAMLQKVKDEAEYFGWDADSYAQAYVGINAADYAVVMAETYTMQAIIFQAIANAEGLNPTQEDMDAFVKDYVENYGALYGITSVDDFYKQYPQEELIMTLLQDNVVMFIQNNAKIVDKQ